MYLQLHKVCLLCNVHGYVLSDMQKVHTTIKATVHTLVEVTLNLEMDTLIG